ncbi:MAG: DUF5680 domain-containing protein [Hyphomicrobiales bacterium]
MIEGLEQFIVEAKAAAYVGGGATLPSSRTNTHDIGFERDNWTYLDSYLGGTDFIGQEAVWLTGQPVWAMNYYGRILRADLIDADVAGHVIKQALSEMYLQGRFLGGFEWRKAAHSYEDENRGNVNAFFGTERIIMSQVEVYRLDYHGGLIKD